jgi:hypothetical protein
MTRRWLPWRFLLAKRIEKPKERQKGFLLVFEKTRGRK